MKKIILNIILFIFVFFILNINVSALTKSEMTILKLNKITSIYKPDNYTAVQGGATTDKYIITLFINETDDKVKNTAILVLDKNTYQKVKLVNNPITDYNFNHANDATYNSKDNELLVLAGRKVYFLDLNNDSFALKKTLDLNFYYHGIGYDEVNNQFVFSRSVNNTTVFEIRNEEFKILNTFVLKTNLTRQSLTVHDGNIYYVCYEAGRITKYQTVYDGLLKRKENVIYVYDLKGKKKTIYYIPYSYREVIFGEIENISFNNDKMLIQFNHTGKAGYFTPEYLREVNAKVTIKTEDKEEKDYLLISDDKEIQRVKTKDNITYNLRYTEEGSYTYNVINEVEEEQNETEEKVETPEEVEEETKEVTEEENVNNLVVDVYYDPTINKLRYKTNAKDLVFTSGKLELENPELEPVIIDVPDTSSNDYYYLLGILILFLNSRYLNKVSKKI